MADLPSFDDLFRVFRDEALASHAHLTRETIERRGSDANLLAAGSAAVGDQLVGQLARLCAGLYLSTAKRQALDRLLFDRYGLARKSAAPAIGSVDFTTATAAAAPFTIPINTKLGTSDGRQFITTAAAVYPFGSTGPVTVAVRSTQAGASQQAAANTITNILGTISGAPADLAVTNPLATAGADNEEPDEEYAERGRRFFTTARKGTIAAVEQAALGVPGVVTARMFENTDAFGRPARSTQLIISDRFTEALVNTSPTPSAYQTQSQQLAEAVFLALYDTRAAGIYIDVFVGQVVLQGVVLGLSFDAGVDADAAALQARAMVVGTINALRPGDPLLVADLVAALRTVPGLIVTGGEILSPPGDVLAAPLEVIRTSLGQVVASTVQPDRALQGSANPDGAF